MGFGQPAGRAAARASGALDKGPARWSPRSSRPTRTSSSGNWPGTSPGAAAASASSRPASSTTSAWPPSPWPTRPSPRRAQDRQGQGQGQGQDRQEARAQARAARGVHRPGDQAHRDARGRPLAGPAAQLQGQHDADRRAAPRHGDHPGQGPGRQRDGLQPDQHRPQGQEAGRLLLDHDRPLRLLGHRVRLQAGRRRRGGRAEEDRRAGARARPGLRDRRGRVPERRSLRQPLGPGLRPLPVRQGPDRPGDRAAQGPGRSRGQGRRLVGQDPPGVRHPARASWATGPRSPRSSSAASRSRATTRPTRTPATRSCPSPGPSSASASSSWPTTSSATRRSSSRRPCSAGWAPSGGCTGATTAISIGPGHRHLGAGADPGHPEDRPGPLPERPDPGPAPEPAAPGRTRAPTRSAWKRSSAP